MCLSSLLDCLGRFGCLLGVLDCLGPAVLTGKGCLLSVLDYLGPTTETSLGVFESMRLMKFDVVGRLGIVWTMEGYWILHWVMGVEPFWTCFGPGRLSGPWTGLMGHGG